MLDTEQTSTNTGHTVDAAEVEKFTRDGRQLVGSAGRLPTAA